MGLSIFHLGILEGSYKSVPMILTRFTSSWGKLSSSNKLVPKGIGINKNIVIKNTHPVTTPNDSGLK